MRRIWDNYKIIGEVTRSTDKKFIVAAAYRDGVPYICVQVFWHNRDADEWYPTKSNISIPLIIPVNDGLRRVRTYKKLTKLMEQASEELQGMPMEDSAHSVWKQVEKYQIIEEEDNEDI